LKFLATAAVLAGVVAFAASPAFALHFNGLYDVDHGSGVGADTDDPSSVPLLDGDATGLDDADTVFHEECNAGTVVPPANGDGDIVANCSNGADPGANGFMGNDQGKDSMTAAFDQVFIVDSTEPDVTHHRPSNKDEAPIGGIPGSQLSAVSSDPWGCVAKPNVNNKNDLLQGFFAFYEAPVGPSVGNLDPGELMLAAGAARDDNSGNETFAVWLFQDPNVDCTVTGLGGTGDFTGVHLDGDTLIVAEFVKGGTSAIINAFVWNDPTAGAPESGDETLDPIGGTGTRCSEETGAAGTHNVINPDLCGEVNDGSIFPAWAPVINDATKGSAPPPELGELEDNQWGEIVANLSDLLGASNTCFAKALIETRTSQSINSNLFDYMLAEVNICGTLTIRKITVGDVGTFTIDSSDTASGIKIPQNSNAGGTEPDANGDFMLTTTVANTPVGETFIDLFAADYDVRETVPAGWRLTNLLCTGDDDDESVLPGAFPIAAGADAVAIIDLDIGENITCTFTNEALADLTLNKTVVNSCTTDTGRFDLRIGGNIAGTGGNVGNGGTTGAVEQAPGTPTASETMAGGGTVTAYDVVISGDCNSTTGDITIAAGDSKSCTFTNTRRAKVTVRKELSPDSDNGKFDLKVTHSAGTTEVADNIGDGGNGSVDVSPGSVTVFEVADAGSPTGLSDYNIFITCDDNAATTASSSTTGSFNVGSGEDVTCVIYNNRKTSGLICLPASP
jgi:hypothetical protein